MATISKITLSNKLLVPEHFVDETDLLPWYYEWQEIVHEPELDEFGEYVLDEFGKPIVNKTPVTHSFRTYRHVFNEDGSSHYAFPRGNIEKLKRFTKRGFADRRPIAPLGYPLKMSERTMEDPRWPDQKRCVDDFMKVGSGIIEGDTGSGKTVMGIGVLCCMRMTVLILSPQKDGSEQWINEIRRHTNIDDLEREHNTKLIGEYQSNKGIEYPITVATVQAFLQKRSKRWLLERKNHFGLILIDEVHAFGAPIYSKVVQALNAFSFLGLTATTERKDRRHHLLFDIVGPVVAKGKAHQMPPEVHFIDTGVEAPAWVYKKNFPRHYQWNVALEQIAKDESRYALIRKYLIKDVDDKRFVACISQRREIVDKLYKLLRKDGYDVAYVDGNTPKRARRAIYNAVREGKIQILFAGKVLNQLVDLPRIDCLHFVTPSSSHTTTKQTYGRARRWLKGKRNPIIRDYVDSGGQFDGAYKNRLALCYQHGWRVKRIDVPTKRVTGLSVWRKRDE